MSKNLYGVFWKDSDEKLNGAWYADLQQAVRGYFSDDFQSAYRSTSLRMTSIPGSESAADYSARILKIIKAEIPDWFNWITLESKHELPADEILNRELAKVQSELGSCHVEIFRSNAKDRAIVRIKRDYWFYKVVGQQVMKTRVSS